MGETEASSSQGFLAHFHAAVYPVWLTDFGLLPLKQEETSANGFVQLSFHLEVALKDVFEIHSCWLIQQKLYELGEVPGDYPMYQPIVFVHEGEGSRAQSLDKLSLDPGDNLDFLSNLGPKFKTLGGLCDKSLKEKNIQLW